LALGAIVVQAARQIAWWKSLVCTLLGILPFMVLFAFFIR
jgi:hypothetical protein